MNATNFKSLPPVNPKLYSQGYSNYFIVNAFVLIVLNVVVWVLSGIFRILKPYLDPWKVGKYEVGRLIVKFFHHNLVIVVFFMTSGDMTQMAFYQFCIMSWATKMDIASAVLAITCMVYYAGFFLYMMYIVVDGSIYTNPEYKDKL